MNPLSYASVSQAIAKSASEAVLGGAGYSLAPATDDLAAGANRLGAENAPGGPNSVKGASQSHVWTTPGGSSFYDPELGH